MYARKPAIARVVLVEIEGTPGSDQFERTTTTRLWKPSVDFILAYIPFPLNVICFGHSLLVHPPEIFPSSSYTLHHIPVPIPIPIPLLFLAVPESTHCYS